MDRVVWWATVQRVAKSQARLSDWHTHIYMHTCSVAKLCPILFDLMDCSPQGSLSMEFSRQEYWSGLPFLLQGIFPTQGLNPWPLHWQVDSLLLSHHRSTHTHTHTHTCTCICKYYMCVYIYARVTEDCSYWRYTLVSHSGPSIIHQLQMMNLRIRERETSTPVLTYDYSADSH